MCVLMKKSEILIRQFAQAEQQNLKTGANDLVRKEILYNFPLEVSHSGNDGWISFPNLLINKMKSFLPIFLLFPSWILTAQSQIGADIDGLTGGDLFGSSVSISADGARIAVGAPSFDSDLFSDAGYVGVYEEVSGEWVLIGNVIEGETDLSYAGHSVALSGDGKRVAIGGLGDPASLGLGYGSGFVRIFEENNGAWEQVGENIYGAPGDQLGFSVSLSHNGKRLAVGAPQNHILEFDKKGYTKIYEEALGAWTQVGETIEGEAIGDLGGYSVSISGNGSRVAIGAPENDENGTASGHVRVFRENAGTWEQVGTDLNGASFVDLSGWAVSLSFSGDRLAIGCGEANFGSEYLGGPVRVFQENNDLWTQVGSDLDGDEEGDNFGSSISLSPDGSHIVIGAPQDLGANFNKKGYAKIFRELGGVWMQVGATIDGEAGADQSGYAVAISTEGDRVAIGGPANDGNGGASGHVRVLGVNLSGTEIPAPFHENLRVFPNPTNGAIQVRLENPSIKPLRFFVHNSSGKIVWLSDEVNQGTLPWEMHIELDQGGVYFVTACAGDNCYTSRILVFPDK